jgi:hypothetical protein
VIGEIGAPLAMPPRPHLTIVCGDLSFGVSLQTVPDTD